MLTDAELDAMQVYCDAASPGPWEGGENYLHVGDNLVRMEHGDMTEGNGQFIAHARTDLPRLIAAYRELRTQFTDACSAIRDEAILRSAAEGKLKAIGWNGGVEATIDGFRAENERLRRELDALCDNAGRDSCAGIIRELRQERDRAVELLTLEESKRWTETARADKAEAERDEARRELDELRTKLANGDPATTPSR